MLRRVKRDLQQQLGLAIRDAFGVEEEPAIGIAPRRELGDLASPCSMNLAKSLRRRPREIAEEIASRMELPPMVDRVTVEGPGFLNFHLRRRQVALELLDEPMPGGASEPLPKVVVEHTNINPNKAAHIGHLRNAVLGDVLVRVLRALGHPTEVQNYIDDTGVQVADVVVGFADLRGSTLDEVAALPEPFDYVCWELYSRVGQWYAEDPSRQELRRTTLHELEVGEGERAELGRLVARRVLRRHLETMQRIGVSYDLLTRESEILRLDFFRAAFDKLVAQGAIREERTGKNAGCWVMPLSQSEEFEGLEDPDKVIVRSDGTVTYVGKDIAYQLWKFGLLGRDFEYRRWSDSEQAEPIWETAPSAERPSAAFGRAHRVINVIDARQSYLQRIVRAGLEALGYHEEAARSVHFAYEMVSLSESTARHLGFLEGGEEPGAPTKKNLEMSGRKGIGVKADDLLDQLESRSREEIGTRNRGLPAAELDVLARQIATAALRFFMAKATTTRLIAFDLDEALSFEGETGPYLQYSLVRVRNILRRLEEEALPTTVSPQELSGTDPELWEDDLWDLLLTVAQTGEILERTGESLELSLVARHALDLAQKFHALYHRHPIKQEPDPSRRAVRLAVALIFSAALAGLCDLLGVPVPERM